MAPFTCSSKVLEIKIGGKLYLAADSGSKDDHIGAVYLSLPSISGDGSTGFLPTFGPCYVNLYGSPREFSHLSNKHDELNKGIGEGAAYRGRVLVQLETKLNAKSGSETEPIFPADIVTVQPYRRRQKFRLLASFLEATMLAVEDSPVEFEMSIGNYGNKLDDTMNPVPSSTPPTNPVFDGEKYYYLPWANSKPYVRINCQWEDITFRLGPLNKLLRICQRLKENIKGIKLTAKVTGLGSDYNKVVCQTLDQLIRDCNPLPELDQERFKITRLDMHLFKTRKTLLESIAKECKELKSKPDNAETLPTIEGFLERIQKVAVEPQNSMPDVIIWMLKGGTQRIAYCRIPAYEVLYNPDDDQRGVHCGKIIDVNLKYPGKKGANETKFPALLRVMVWLGLEEHQGEWDELEKTGGELSVYAETYENQTSWLVDWSSKNMTRPSFSDANGTRSLPKNAFKEPIGWQFVTDDWKIRPELSSQYAKDSGCKWFLEDAFENEHRYMPGGMWQRNDSLAWTDIYGEVLLDEREKPIKSKDDIMPPKGWQWSEETWRVDKDRAVDHDGWEYTTETSFGLTNYESAERTIHFSRRRRWIRERKNVNGSKAEAPEIMEKELDRQLEAILPKPETMFAQLDMPPNKEGWEYAISFSTRFHTKRRAFDMVRRRRLQRKLKRTMPGAPEPIFTIKKDKESVLIPPSIFLFFREPHLCELRAYIYQGRNLKPSDPDGLADPYIQLSFGTRSATSKTIHKKLNPTWNQMLVLENVPIYGHYDQISENPPDVTLELFDRDPVGKNYMGRVRVEPTVLLPNEIPASDTKLSWRQVCHGPNSCGDVLAAFELFMDSDIAVPSLPSVDDHGLYPIPRHISPKMQNAVVEVLCWGLRNLARYRWMRVKSPSVEIEIGDKILETSVIRNMKANPNFKETPVLCFNVDLPRDVIYTPPITMRLRSNGSYGHPIIGVCVIENLQEYHRDEVYCPLGKNEKNETGTSKPSQAVVTVEQETPAPSERKESILESLIDKDDHEESFDWWSKYYASRNILDRQGHGGDYPKHYDKIKIYPRALEQEFNFEDFIKTFYFRRGEADSSDDFDADSIVGEFKGSLSIYNPPEGSNDSLPPKVFTEERLRHLRPAPCLIRVYIIRAYGLTAKDRNGLADPYLVVSLGSKTFNDKDSYAAETLDVQFGKVFEFHAVIPVVKNLNIKVMDHDPYSPHDLIGETQIDLESRLLSRRHAIAGLPDSYNTSGPNKWRLGEKYTPSVILSNFCKENDMEPPRFLDSNKQVVLKSRHDEQIFTIDQFRDKPTDPRHAGPRMERLALHVLREKLQLVPEHVETRDLMNSLHPSFPQGKLEMFVDIIPDCNGHPGPRVNIAPRKPKKYELRVIVWNTKDVLLDDKSVLGEEMSDIFVKCKLNGVHDFQKTDVHYRSLNGDGMFNWRMIFPFEYSETNKKIVVMKKAHLWSRREFRDELAPELIVEIWDNDLVTFNDFIGSVTLNLHELSEPFARSKEIKDHHCKEKKGSLFRKGSVRGWWPVTGKKRKKKKSKYKKKDNYYEQGLTGKVELTIELLEDKEAAAKPVGKGQDKPNQHPVLLKPQRPETSFLWIINPWKSFRYIFWHHYKWYFIGLIVLVLLILLIALFIYSAPGYSVKKLFNA